MTRRENDVVSKTKLAQYIGRRVWVSLPCRVHGDGLAHLDFSQHLSRTQPHLNFGENRGPGSAGHSCLGDDLSGFADPGHANS
jgi:hypothetical protein